MVQLWFWTWDNSKIAIIDGSPSLKPLQCCECQSNGLILLIWFSCPRIFSKTRVLLAESWAHAILRSIQPRNESTRAVYSSHARAPSWEKLVACDEIDVLDLNQSERNSKGTRSRSSQSYRKKDNSFFFSHHLSARCSITLIASLPSKDDYGEKKIMAVLFEQIIISQFHSQPKVQKKFNIWSFHVYLLFFFCNLLIPRSGTWNFEFFHWRPQIY